MVSKNTLKMLKQLFPIFMLILLSTQGYAQTPNPVRTNSNPDAPESSICAPGLGNFAGTVTIDPATHVGSSNDVSGEPIYLCFGDQITIDHDAGSASFLGDPDGATTPGVGYVFYSCPPDDTFDGDLATILMDPCLIPNPVPGDADLFIVAGNDTSGDVDFINLGIIQTLFNAGDPYRMWFLPTTYDALDMTNNPPTVVWESANPSGPCVDANHNEAFSVVYLNEIQESNVQNTMGTGTCQGSFLIEGGLPEFDGNETYDISITLNSNPIEEASITNGDPFHGDVVEFQVFTPGMYTVTVTDGKACPATFTIDMTGCQSIGMNIPTASGLPTEEVCLPVTVTNFNDILSYQYVVTWDPAILQFSDTNFVALNALDVFVNLSAPGSLTILFTDNTFAGVTVADGSVIYELCFTIIGPNGTSSPVEIGGTTASPLDAFDVNGNYIAFTLNNGQVNTLNQGNFDIDVMHTDISCNGAMDGSFTIDVNGTGNGVAPYTVNWTNTTTGATGMFTGIPNGGTVTENGLPAGDYEIVITDSDTPVTSDTEMFEIVEPGVLVVNIAATPPLCNGGTDGTLAAQVSIGGVIISDFTGYTFSWSPGGGNTQTISNYIPGTVYTVNVTSPNGCPAMDTGSGTTPAPLAISFASTDATCTGVNDGEIIATPSGGVNGTTYSYAWSTTPTQTTQTISNLAPGTYTLTITDDNMCTIEEDIVIGAATVLNAIGTPTDVQCFGGNDGMVVMMPTVTGTNNGPFSYAWSPNVPPPNNTATASTLLAGTYTVTVSDPAGCTAENSFMINSPQNPVTAGMVTTTDETCALGGMDGTASVTPSGGTVAAGYTYMWSCCPTVNGPIATGIGAGMYTVTVLDDNNCESIETFTINPPTPPTISMFDSISVACPNNTDGELTVTALPGNTAITSYLWSNGGMNPTISNLGPGTYTVTVTAADGCTVEDEATLWAPDQLIFGNDLSDNPSCFGLSDGTASVQMNGGTTPYLYQWSANAGNSTFATVPGLPSGTYTVTVTDGNFCDQVVVEVELQDPPEIEVVFTTQTPVSCFGDINNCDGSATAIASGGGTTTGLYNFTWSSGEVETGVASSTAIMLCQGQQFVTVSDANACFAEVPIIIDTPDPLDIIPTFTEPSCFQDSDGSILATGDGGTPGYNILWDNGTTDPLLDGIPAGTYPVTITDFSGCEFDTIFTLGQPDELIAIVDTYNTNDISCNGEADGQIAITFTGGNDVGTPQNMSYIWSNTGTTSTINNLTVGTYTVTISDSEGCTATVQHTISEPLEITAVIPTPDEPQCFGFQTFMTVESAGGGAGTVPTDYSFSIDDGPTQDIGTQIPVFAGTHTVTVFDQNGCFFEDEITIGQPQEVIVDLGPDIEIQLGETTQLNAVLSGSIVPIDSIIWTPNIFDTTSCINCLNPIVGPIDNQLYSIEIFNTDGCTGSDEILVEVDKNRNVYIPNAFSPNGDGFNDYFQIFTGPGVSNINSIQIFDRWGEVVYQAIQLDPTPFPDSSTGWNGKMDGRIMNPGVFVYLVEVEFEDGVTLLFRGDVTLLH